MIFFILKVYGENICVARDLKGFGGRMNCTIHPIKGKDLLPQSDHHPECRAPSGFCFIAGKYFVNTLYGKTSI